MQKLNSSYDTRLRAKMIELLHRVMPESDMEKMLSNDAMALYRQAFTHRYADKTKNYETLELLGDKFNGAVLMNWLFLKFPGERDEGVLSDIVAFFLSKPKLAEYSQMLGLPSLLIKPELYPPVPSDYEDIFEALMGAIIRCAHRYIAPYSGSAVVAGILEPIFEAQRINPANRKDYIDKVSLLKQGANVFTGHDPSYKVESHIQRTREGGRERVQTFYSCSVFLFDTGRQEYLPAASLERSEYATSKQRAKEAVSVKALEKLAPKGWTWEGIEGERKRKEEESSRVQRTFIEESIVALRKIALRGMRGGSEKEFLEARFGSKKARLLSTPVDSLFSVERNEDIGEKTDVAVELFIRYEDEPYTLQGTLISKPNSVANSYRRLAAEYIKQVEETLGIQIPMQAAGGRKK